LYSQGRSRWTGTALIGISSSHEHMLTCRQVTTVISAFGKASHVLAINGDDKTKIGPKICDPVNEHLT